MDRCHGFCGVNGAFPFWAFWRCEGHVSREKIRLLGLSVGIHVSWERARHWSMRKLEGTFVANANR